MYFYKAINEGKFLGIATSSNLGKLLQKRDKSNLMVNATEEDAQYILVSGNWYHAMWLRPETIIAYCPTVELVQIDENEYNILLEAIEKNEEITVDQESVDEIPEPIIEEKDTSTLEFIITSKISELSDCCNKAITSGFDVELSDGKISHFSLSTQDQLNLITLSTLVASGENAIPYHADGELCKFYTPEDVMKILNAATAHKTFHVSYYNSLKTYVSSLDDINIISAIQYGVDIPEDYQSDVLKVLLLQIGGIS